MLLKSVAQEPDDNPQASLSGSQDVVALGTNTAEPTSTDGSIQVNVAPSIAQSTGQPAAAPDNAGHTDQPLQTNGIEHHAEPGSSARPPSSPTTREILHLSQDPGIETIRRLVIPLLKLTATGRLVEEFSDEDCRAVWPSLCTTTTQLREAGLLHPSGSGAPPGPSPEPPQPPDDPPQPPDDPPPATELTPGPPNNAGSVDSDAEQVEALITGATSTTHEVTSP